MSADLRLYCSSVWVSVASHGHVTKTVMAASFAPSQEGESTLAMPAFHSGSALAGLKT